MSKKTAQSPSQTPPPANFLLRTMLEREATGKRRIRPKNVDHLLQAARADESDDSDFDFHDEDSDSDGSNASDHTLPYRFRERPNAVYTFCNDDVSDSDDEIYIQPDYDDGGSPLNTGGESDEAGGDSGSSCNESSDSESDAAGPDTYTLEENRTALGGTKPICSVCLGDNSDDSNEVLECDSCGISVHEYCYGLSSDNLSVSSGSSSCTEPWFCDVCKSNADTVSCELCPVQGGLLKESKSKAGQWAHLLCAMYTPGVVLYNNCSMDFFGIKSSDWGSHSCAACEDECRAKTGIAIACDAGFCKTWFHATCGQKLGLLSDPINQVNLDEADPYFVSCQTHSYQEAKIRHVEMFNALQEQLRIKGQRKKVNGLAAEETADHARILRKLEKVREKTATERANYFSSLENELPTNSQARPKNNQLPPCFNNGNKKQELAADRRKSRNAISGNRKSSTPGSSSTALHKKSERLLTPSPSDAGTMTIVVALCATCATADDRRIMTRCDKCHKYYHLQCLDPPLTTMPKTSRVYGWNCSICCVSPSNEEVQVDTEAPRSLRSSTKNNKRGKYGSPDLKPIPKELKQNLNNVIEIEKQSEPERGESLVASEPSSRNSSSTSPSGKRRRRISADLSSLPASPLNSTNPTVNGPTMPSDILTFNPTGSIQMGDTSTSPESFLVTANASKSEKRKKSASAKRATTPATNSSRKDESNVNLAMKKVTSQFMVDKLKGIKSGPFKSKKRKNVSALGTNSTSATKLVRKRASSSTAQNQLQHNCKIDIDSVIECVVQANSTGSENCLMLGNGSVNS